MRAPMTTTKFQKGEAPPPTLAASPAGRPLSDHDRVIGCQEMSRLAILSPPFFSCSGLLILSLPRNNSLLT